MSAPDWESVWRERELQEEEAREAQERQKYWEWRRKQYCPRCAGAVPGCPECHGVSSAGRRCQVSHYPGIEATILRTIAEEGEAMPPRSPRLAQEYWWMAAAQLQARGLIIADQQAGVVKPEHPGSG